MLPSPPSSDANGLTRSQGKKKKKVLVYVLHVGPFTSWLFNNFPIYGVSSLGKEPYLHVEIQQGRAAARLFEHT